ncbi:unnamed protein product [Dovyalis caffra]|uniref:Apple domain-containing protein n=1 Tax=Dovyalis caffra TaxID=77055 RepID=A0AAV1SUH9_9ROSI|nr:unnamed protein product [Dovyalis caffra]
MASKARILILVMFSSFMFLMGPSYSKNTDTLIQGQKLNCGDQLVSAYGMFKLGFFHRYFSEQVLGDSSRHTRRSKYYIGICYHSNFYVQRGPLDVRISAGCDDRTYPICRKDLSHISRQVGSVSGDEFKFDENEKLTINDCREKCLRNCSCVAYASTNKNNEGIGCQIWSRLKLGTTTYPNWHTVYVLESKGKMTYLQKFVFFNFGKHADASANC